MALSWAEASETLGMLQVKVRELFAVGEIDGFGGDELLVMGDGVVHVPIGGLLLGFLGLGDGAKRFLELGGDFIEVELGDLFFEADDLGGQALPLEKLLGLLVGLECVGVVLLLGVGVAHHVVDVGVLGVVDQEFLVFLDGLVPFARLDIEEGHLDDNRLVLDHVPSFP